MNRPCGCLLDFPQLERNGGGPFTKSINKKEELNGEEESSSPSSESVQLN